MWQSGGRVSVSAFSRPSWASECGCYIDVPIWEGQHYGIFANEGDFETVRGEIKFMVSPCE